MEQIVGIKMFLFESGTTLYINRVFEVPVVRWDW